MITLPIVLAIAIAIDRLFIVRTRYKLEIYFNEVSHEELVIHNYLVVKRKYIEFYICHEYRGYTANPDKRLFRINYKTTVRKEGIHES
jgi:hypothetical protein